MMACHLPPIGFCGTTGFGDHLPPERAPDALGLGVHGIYGPENPMLDTIWPSLSVPVI